LRHLNHFGGRMISWLPAGQPNFPPRFKCPYESSEAHARKRSKPEFLFSPKPID
jgi:hypothetical protein